MLVTMLTFIAGEIQINSYFPEKTLNPIKHLMSLWPNV